MFKDLLPGNIGSFAATAALTLLASCSFQPVQEATDAEVQMVGMTKQQVFTCMGVPAQKAQEGSTEIWTYPSGDGQTATFTDASVQAQAYGKGGAYGTGSAYGVTARRFCTINIAFQYARVSQVNYVGPTGELVTQGEQCAFAVKNCLQQAR
jgi:outer membrane protein assembly factor BamE (lipoprotein component of BamABCDE complex)